jgi:hypothetical protein
MDRTLYALDLAKQVFQVFWVEERSAENAKQLENRSKSVRNETRQA